MRKYIVIGVAFVLLAAVNISIYTKQKLLTEGKTVFLELAPVDPRSLMQGDYMALRFKAAEAAFRSDINSLPGDGRIVLVVAEKGIATYSRFDDGTPLATGEIVMRYRIRNGQPKFATNAFFFQEGHAQYYSRARYGEFRVAENGEAILVGMRGDGLKVLGPPVAVSQQKKKEKFVPAVTKSGVVTGTGLTTCCDNATEIECPKHGETFYGQDANYSINPPSYTKLSSDGNALPDDAPSWAMVRDDLTGLVWEMKDKSDNKKDYSNPNDPDNTYTWYDKESNFGAPGNGDDTAVFINILNTARYGGYSDWRLPTISELTNLLKLDRRPCIDKSYFPNMWFGGDCVYWSSSICRTVHGSLRGQPFVQESRIWQACFGSFLIVNDYGANRSRAIAVRGHPAVQSHDLIDTNDGTVTDTTTGLMWQKETAPGKYDWKQALAYCDNLTLAGYKDWRLPTAKELHSIVDYRKIKQCINTDYFPDTRKDKFGECYWSSTTIANSPRGAYVVEFREGGKGEQGKSATHYVRAVRGGQLAGLRGDGLKVLGTSVRRKEQQRAQSSSSTVAVVQSENPFTTTVTSSHIKVSESVF